jgi:hypothetical protein
MGRRALLVPMVLACSRTPLGLHVPDGGSPGMGGAGGSVVMPPASGGSLGDSGAGDGSPGHIGGAGGVGGKPATGGIPGTGGSPSASGGSVSSTDLDTCSSDADCTSCLWAPAPTDASQCPGYFNCCGGMSAPQKRCEANQVAWNASCPGQTPQYLACPCVLLCEGVMTLSCVEGRCILTCPPNNDASPDVAFVAADGSSGNGGAGGTGGANTGSGGIVGTSGMRYGSKR